MYNKAIIESEIATNNRHMFLYGRNTPHREELLKTIADKYPFVLGSDVSCVIYIDDIGLPKIEGKNENVDKNKLSIIAMQYLEFTIIEAILSKIIPISDIPTEFVKRITQIFSYFSKNKSSNITELVEGIRSGKEFWASFYRSYRITGDDGEFDNKTSSLNIVFAPFLDRFTENLLEAANIKAPFQFILDRKKEISIYSVQSINSLIGSRINGEMNIKVACECDEWESVWDGYGNVAEYVHDYTILELDNSLQESICIKKK